ncbi:MAG: hypothetical protein NTU62_00680 [Spirochaetes bacterium]|nr:hypothetical protein [Spirochaetota bacterium]
MNGMRGIIIVACLLAAGSAAADDSSRAPAPGSTELVENAGAWDGRIVGFAGEALGEAMRRGTMAWIHLNDDAYGLADAGAAVKLAGANSGIGVWVDSAMASRITSFGTYGRHGDLVEVIGTFHAACPQHGGDTDIHATSLRIVRPGYATVQLIRPSRMIAAAILAGLTLGLFLVNLRVDQRSAGGGRPPGTGRIQPPHRGTLGG